MIDKGLLTELRVYRPENHSLLNYDQNRGATCSIG
jgi:hypothetical protein